MDTSYFSAVKKDNQQYYYYNGEQWKESLSNKRVAVRSPHDGHVVGEIQQVTNEEINSAIQKASEAYRSWEQKPLYERIDIIKKTAVLMREHIEIFTNLLVEEIGKSYEESKSEVLRTADILDFTAQEVQSISGEEIESDQFPGFAKGKISIAEHVAHGVVLAIAPFNYPINLAATKIVPALLMGNAVIFKPPTQGSLSGLYLTHLFIQAGLPPHVLSCLTGAGKDMGNYLTSHKGIQMIAFTGSTSVGTAIAQSVGMKTLLFECGGNNPIIVLPDADMELTAREVVKGAFSYSGQRCTGIKFILAEQAVLDILLPKVKEQVDKLIHMGPPQDKDTKLVGPVISEESAISIQQSIESAVQEGAKIYIGGKRNGTYIEPTILVDVMASMKIVCEEVFGPVVSCIAIQSTDEAVSIINRSQYGLQASIFTSDEGAGISLSKQLEVGTVQLNGSPQRGPDNFPFMGIKGSGIGVQGVKYSLLAMSRLKSFVLNSPQ